MQSEGANWILNKFNFTNVVAVEARGFAGGLWCFWDIEDISLKVLNCTAQMINVEVLRNNKISWLLSLVYASPVVSMRDTFCEFVECMSRFVNIPWCMIGDLNQVTCQDDKLGGRRVMGYAVERMRHMIEVCGFQGLEFSGPRYTWTNCQLGRFNIKQRLDQCWCNPAWDDLFPDAYVKHLTRVHSDHHPIMLSTRPEVAASHGFRFQNGWMEHNGFADFMQSAWTHFPNDIIRTVDGFKSKLLVWKKEVYGNLSHKKKRCLARLDGIQRELSVRPSKYLSNLETQLHGEYTEIGRLETEYWRQKSHLNWITVGERNSRFFHKSLIRKGRRKNINCLKFGDDVWVEDASELRQMVRDFYVKLYADGPTTCPRDTRFEFPTLSHNDSRFLNRPVSVTEIEAAVFQMGAHKAPGPDGLTPGLLQRYWHVVRESVINFVLTAFTTCHFPVEMNESIITLIPKVKHPEDIKQFRPIALTNVITKIISKVIANRLKGLVGKLVSSNQCAFTPGRQAAENIIITNEIIHTMKKKKGSKGLMAVKIDLEKAYDQVSWPFLRRVLESAGFCPKLVELIMFTVSTASLSIIWNGSCTQSFRPSRGIRQGDPLAPYLFLLCMEVLSQNIKSAVDQKHWAPVMVCRGGPAISHVFFADDLFLFGAATVEQASVMEGILKDFCAVSGQRISYTKSQFHTSSNTRLEIIEELASRLNMTHTKVLGKYLGMPVMHGRVTVDNFDFLIDNLRGRLSTWRSKILSQAGRALLIQSVLTALPSYVMQITRIPSSVIKALEKTIRAFFWAELDGSRKLHYMPWDRVCQPQEVGGLGIRRLARMNIAFLVKLGWSMLTEPDKLWARVLWAKYGSPLGDSYRQDVSFIWRGIRSCKSFLLKGMGSTVDNEVPAGSDMLRTVHWKAEDSGIFSLASAYKIQTSTTEAMESQAWHRIWRLKGPSRANFFLWRLRHDTLPTTSFLYRRHISATSTCGICGENGSDALHELRDCRWMAKVWRLVVSHGCWPDFCSPQYTGTWVDRNLSCNMGVGVTTLGWKYLFREVAFGGWIWRNKFVHNTVDRLIPPAIFVKEAMSRLRLLILAHEIDPALFLCTSQ